jgi:hypothetical protein
VVDEVEDVDDVGAADEDDIAGATDDAELSADIEDSVVVDDSVVVVSVLGPHAATENAAAAASRAAKPNLRLVMIFPLVPASRI